MLLLHVPSINIPWTEHVVFFMQYCLLHSYLEVWKEVEQFKLYIFWDRVVTHKWQSCGLILGVTVRQTRLRLVLFVWIFMYVSLVVNMYENLF